MSKKINLIGVEIEGGWASDKNGEPISTIGTPMEDKIGQDGSVKQLSSPHFGEAPSPALPREEAIEWMRKHWCGEVNKYCGFHIHISFRNLLSYSRIMDEKFFNHFLKECETFGKKMNWDVTHPFWGRLKGENQFCVPTHNPDEQAELKTKGNNIRYTALNYCYSMHSTLECRLFPAFSDVEEAVKCVNFYCDTVEDYLEALPREERKTFIMKLDQIDNPKTFNPKKGKL